MATPARRNGILFNLELFQIPQNAFNGCENVLFQVIDGSRGHSFIKDLGYDFEQRYVKFNRNNLLSNIYTSDIPNKQLILRFVKPEK